MILIINTSGGNLEFVLGDKYKSVVVEKQSIALPTETEETSPEIEFVWPVENGYVASKMESYKGHTGIDIAAKDENKNEILAAADGTVVKVKWSNIGYGYHIIIHHKKGVQTCYAHCSDMYVKVGQEVKAGEPIGKIGSTGTHLHFEIRIMGEYVDPEEYLPN